MTKDGLLKKLLLFKFFIMFFIGVYSQDILPYDNPDYGPDSTSRMECAANLSTMSEYMKINLHEYAQSAWEEVFKNCPAASKNIYITGAKIYKKKIEETSDPEKRQVYLDTLMLIYDQRIKYFGEESYVLGRKGMDIIQYNEQAYDQAYEAFSKSAELGGIETNVNAITGLIQTASVMYKSDQITAAKYLGEYIYASELLDQMKQSGTNPRKINQVASIIDNVLLNTKVDDCESIESKFGTYFQESGYKPEIMESAIDLMEYSGCDNSQFYADLNEKLMEIDPDPKKAYEVAKYNIKNENFVKAVDFLEKAINNESNPEQKAKYQYQMALILNGKLDNPRRARDIAKRAVENNTDWGEPYFVIASAYINGISECAENDFQKSAIYWLAVDYLIKAKSVDPSVANRANELINQYKQYYPSVEEDFFRGLNKGDQYTFNCWINETTTVKMN